MRPASRRTGTTNINGISITTNISNIPAITVSDATTTLRTAANAIAYLSLRPRAAPT